MNKRYFTIFPMLGMGMVFLFLLSNRLPAQARLLTTESMHPKLDAYVEEQMHALKIPGLALAVVRGDQVEYVRGYGVADSKGRPVTPQTPFLIASMSKSFTALGIMQLVEEGKLELDSPVQEYLPWFRVADAEAAAQITVRHLLYHTSGLSELGGYKRNIERDRAENGLEASVRRLSSSRLNSQPGTVFEYSNTNYDVLGLLIQTLSGMPYADYIEEKIFAPLKMQHSFTSLDEARAGGLSSGYLTFFGVTLKYDRLMPYSHTVLPSAGLFSSAEDLAYYLIAYLNQGISQDGTVILSPAGVAELHAPGVNTSEQVSYAMGWNLFPFNDIAAANNPDPTIPTGISHAGDWANFKSIMVLIPEQELGVVILMNKSDPKRESAYYNIVWNAALLAAGLETINYPANEDFLTQYGRLLGVIIIALLAANFVWTARWIFNRSADTLTHSRRRQFRTYLIVLPLLDLFLSGFLLFVVVPQQVTTVPVTLRFQPDAGLIFIVVLIFTLGWGSLRTVLAIRKLFITGAERA